MNTCEVIHQWREKAALLFVPEKFDFQCDLWQHVEHYTLQQAHITVLLIMQLTAKTQLFLQDVIHMSITKWTVVVLCHTEQHAPSQPREFGCPEQQFKNSTAGLTVLQQTSDGVQHCHSARPVSISLWPVLFTILMTLSQQVVKFLLYHRLWHQG